MPSHACPICRKKIEYALLTDVPTFPFCSERCRLVDFGRWIDEGYVISQSIAPEDEKKPATDDEEGDGERKAPDVAEDDAGD